MRECEREREKGTGREEANSHRTHRAFMPQGIMYDQLCDPLWKFRLLSLAFRCNLFNQPIKTRICICHIILVWLCTLKARGARFIPHTPDPRSVCFVP